MLTINAIEEGLKIGESRFKGPISITSGVETWAEVNLTSFSGPINLNTAITRNVMEIRAQVFLSGALIAQDSSREIYRVDNSHGFLEQHLGEQKSIIEDKTVGDALLMVFRSRF